MSSQSSKQLKRRTFSQGQWPHKTIDVGCNGVAVSANPLGQVYQLSAPLAATNKFGIMVAAPWPQFDHSQRTDPNYVREFRKIPERLLNKKRSGLGFEFEGRKGPVVIRHVRDSIGSHAQFEYRIHDSNLFVQTVLKVQNHGTVIHASKITNMSSKAQSVPVTLDMAFAVSRAGYGQLTDRGAVDMPDSSNVLDSLRGSNGAGVLAVDNTSLGGRVLAHIVFYNTTTHKYIEVDTSLLAQRGVQNNPPHRPIEKAQQVINMVPGETLMLAVSFRPENIPSSDKSATLSEIDEAHEIAPDALFSHQDGVSDPIILLQRHVQEISGLNGDLTETIESTILWANVNYILGCCCVPISHPQGYGTCCIADHFALNLGWPRDNYWQMRLLRKLDPSKLEQLLPNNRESVRQYNGKIHEVLTNHLFWLFQIAITKIEIDGEVRHFWRRSYLVNGLPKDGAVFQLDTQCYPFLELCEYFEAYENEPQVKSIIEFVLQTETFKHVLQDLLSRKDDATDLFGSDETPADDDLGDYKFHLSSNILLWHTLRKLNKLLSHSWFRSLAPADQPWEALRNQATVIKEAILKNFRSRRGINTHGNGDQRQTAQEILAYGFDPAKKLQDPNRYRHYHDGNDMPTLYAQEWGFLKSDDEDPDNDPELRDLWEDTLVWAFTPGPASSGFNAGYQGNGSEPFHGLGSDHSPGPWTLGFFQEWKFAQMVGDETRERKAWRQIEGSAQFDGTFSEAVDISTGKCTSKTWFSWPGAMIAENLVDTVIKQTQERAT